MSLSGVKTGVQKSKGKKQKEKEARKTTVNSKGKEANNMKKEQKP